ncbi:MAG: HAD-IA family hydrolase [Legionella sp.]|nr:HAD-IA family hydrolase [Legionella sp.]
MNLLLPRALLLDLDGTLADSLSVMYQVYQRFLAQFQCEPSNAEFDSLNGPPLNEVVHRLKASHQLEGDENTLLANYYDLIDAVYLDVKPAFGAQNLLQKAKEQGAIVGIVTSNTKKRTETWLKSVLLRPMIDFIVSGEEVTKGKPHPEPYISASKKTCCQLSEIVAIEDSPQGARAAIDAGLKTLVVNYEKNNSWPQGVQPITSLLQAAEQWFSN